MKKPRELKFLDIFYAKYGYEVVKFVVKGINKWGVIATSPRWLKESGHFFKFGELEEDKSYYTAGKSYSRLRWFFKI